MQTFNQQSTFWRIAALTTLCLSASLAAFANDVGPKELYSEYRQALRTATSIEQIAPFLSSKVNEEIKTTPAEVKTQMFGVIKETAVPDTQVTDEKTDGDKSALTLIGAKPNSKQKVHGKLLLVRENGDWKIDKEIWNEK